MPHTPEPWNVDSRIHEIGIIAGPSPDGSFHEVATINDSLPDATLIAASPELLEAAENLLRSIFDAGPFGPDDGLVWYPDAWDLKCAIDRLNGCQNVPVGWSTIDDD